MGARLSRTRAPRRPGPAAVPRPAQRSRLGQATQCRKVGAQPVFLYLRRRALRCGGWRPGCLEPRLRRAQPRRGQGECSAEPGAGTDALRPLRLFPGDPPTRRTAGGFQARPRPARLPSPRAAPVRSGTARPPGLGTQRLRHGGPAARLPEPAETGIADHRRRRRADLLQQPGEGADGRMADAGAALRRQGGPAGT